jgi:hypothetical protein
MNLTPNPMMQRPREDMAKLRIRQELAACTPKKGSFTEDCEYIIIRILRIIGFQ